MELDLWDERAGGRGWTVRQALGHYNRLRNLLAETGSEWVCGKVEAGGGITRAQTQPPFPPGARACVRADKGLERKWSRGAARPGDERKWV